MLVCSRGPSAGGGGGNMARVTAIGMHVPVGVASKQVEVRDPLGNDECMDGNPTNAIWTMVPPLVTAWAKYMYSCRASACAHSHCKYA